MVLVGVAFLVVAVSFAAIVAERFTARRVMTRRTVIVNLKTSKAFRGVLWKERGGILVLRQADLHEKGTVVTVDGEVVLERSNVDFVQLVTAGK